jgi:RNA polymerase sigma-70 factor (ECF subfamily)
MKREELNWLETSKNAETAEFFVLAQYDRGRTSYEVIADAGRERGSVHGNANESLTTTRNSSEYGRPQRLVLPDRSSPMSTQSVENYDRKETGGPGSRRGNLREEYTRLAAAKRGDSAAFEVLCKQSANTVFRVARRIVRNDEDAEDVVQESFQRAFIHLNSFNGDSRFSTWLSRIAINAALMKLRKKHRLGEVSLDEPAEPEQPSSQMDVEDQGLNPEQLYSQEERRQILTEAMSGLTPGMRKAFELREIDERSTEETARMMGISVGAVKARLFHGRRKLRERLKRHVGSAWRYGRDASQAIGNSRRVLQDPVACNAGD